MNINAVLAAGMSLSVTTIGLADGQLIALPANYQPTGMSADGSIVVGFTPSGSFMWTADGIALMPGNTLTGNIAISADGSMIIGTTLNGAYEEAAYWNGAEWVPLGHLGFTCDANGSSGWGVNGDGSVIVGLGWIEGCGAHATAWYDLGPAMDLGSIIPGASSRANNVSADGTVIVGWQDNGFRQGAMWVDGVESLFTYEGGPVGEAQSVTPDGTYVVGGYGGPFNEDAWLWSDAGGMEVLGNLPGFNYRSIAADVSDDGSMVVGFSGFGFDRQAFVWNGHEDGVQNLLDYATAAGVDTTGWLALQIATVVSADGSVIAGWGDGPASGFSQGFVIQLGGATCDGDIDGDGTVAVSDLLAVLAAWGDCAGCPEDIDGDGTVSVSDLLIVLGNWGDC